MPFKCSDEQPGRSARRRPQKAFVALASQVKSGPTAPGAFSSLPWVEFYWCEMRAQAAHLV